MGRDKSFLKSVSSHRIASQNFFVPWDSDKKRFRLMGRDRTKNVCPMPSHPMNFRTSQISL